MKRFLVAFAVLVACAAACNDDPESHVYVAALYDPADGCFGPSVSLGTIDTPDGDLDCAPVCLVLTNDQPKKVYMSTMCGPYPVQFDVSQTDPECQLAFEAWPAEVTAFGNGTNSCASPSASDGGAGGGDDAGPDAADAGGEDAIDASDAGDGSSPSDAQSE